MTIYNSPAMSKPARTALGANVVTTTFPVTALALNDVINLAKIPAGAVLHDVHLNFDDLDSGTALTFSCGDSGNAARFLTGSNTAQSGGFTRMNLNGFQAYAADDTLLLKCTAAPTGIQAGNIKATVQYHLFG